MGNISNYADTKYMEAAVDILERLPQRYPYYFVMEWRGNRDLTSGATIGGYPIGSFESSVVLTPAKESLGFYFPIAKLKGKKTGKIKIISAVIATDHDVAFNPDGIPSPEPALPERQLSLTMHPTGLKTPKYRFGFI